VTDDLFEYQTYLQGLANQLGEDIARLIGSTDRELVELLLREISKLPKDKRKAHQKLQRLEKTIEELRGKGFDKGLEVSYGTVKELIDAAGSVAQKEILAENAKKQERDIRASRIPKSLSDRQVDDILDYTPLDGRTVRQWFARFQRNDTELIMQTIQRGFVEGHTLETIIRSIRGTKEHNFQNGILETSRQSARMLGRTLVNGASNAARLAMFEANMSPEKVLKFKGIGHRASGIGHRIMTCSTLFHRRGKGGKYCCFSYARCPMPDARCPMPSTVLSTRSFTV